MTQPDSAIPVLYIVSHPRSGSTLVGSVLGLAKGHVYVGEVRDVWRDGLQQNERCGCGQPFRQCPFWTDVFQRAFGGFDTAEAISAASAFDRLATWTGALRLLPLAWRFPLGKGSAPEYATPLARLYSAIRDVSGADVIVDSSKTMRYAALLAATPGIAITLTNLVRDPRGIVHSRMQRARYRDGSEKPEAEGYGKPRVVKVIAKWVTRNMIAARAMARDGGVRLLYEDFTANPRWYLEAVLGKDEAERVLAQLQQGIGADIVQHQIAGNWVRGLKISPSNRWMTDLAGVTRFFASLFSAPFRRLYRSRRYTGGK